MININGVTREMTPKEEAEFESNLLPVDDDGLTIKEILALHTIELETQADDIGALVETTDDMILMMAELIGN